jgi:hypothetical protein
LCNICAPLSSRKRQFTPPAQLTRSLHGLTCNVQVPGDVGPTNQISGVHGIREVHVSSQFVRWAAMQDEHGNIPQQTPLSRDFDTDSLDDVLCYGFSSPLGTHCVLLCRRWWACACRLRIKLHVFASHYPASCCCIPHLSAPPPPPTHTHTHAHAARTGCATRGLNTQLRMRL